MAGLDGLSLSVEDLKLDDFLLILAGALIAFVGPNSQTLALEKLRPIRLTAIATGLSLIPHP